MQFPTTARALLLAPTLLLGLPLAAQTPDTVLSPSPAPTAGPGIMPDTLRSGQEGRDTLRFPDGGLVLLGSVAEDRLRVLQILGREPATGFLLRTPATLTEAARGGRPLERHLEWVAPRLETVHNSALPFSQNDGPLWAGRGRNHQMTAGARLVSPRLTLVLAPQLVYAENRRFDIINYTGNDRSPYASPWHENPESADLPLRFGAQPILRFVPGQSRVAVSAGPVQVGASTESQWWGPGVRNAIVLSSNAEGVPRLFLRTDHPVRTRLGNVEGEWMIGALSESRFFDTIPDNDTRSLSALALTFTPAGEPGLTLGFSRVVYAPADGMAAVLGNLFDVFTDVGLPNARPVTDTVRTPGPDEIFAIFGRWIFPADGVEVYGEWARHERPHDSLLDFLAAPNHTQGYTVGLQWARPVRESVLRVGAEATNLEQSATYRQRRVASYYTSRSVLQGYTQRGQILGAATGPGSSAQWAAADWLSSRWSAGLFGGRIRWENDSHYTLRDPPLFLDVGHDVSLFGGVRGSLRIGDFQIMGDITSAMRYNYLSQHLTSTFGDYHGVDVQNYTVRLTVAPFGGV